MGKRLLCMLAVFCMLFLSACADKNPTAGSTVRFNDLEIRVGKLEDIKLIRVTDQQSEYFAKTVARVPITIKNLSGDPHSLELPYYSFYDPRGDALYDLSREYMDEDEANWTGDIQPGETREASFYILYDESGTYTIKLEKPGEDDIKIKIDLEDDAGATSSS